MGDLPEYAAALPSDTQQFLSIDEAARNRIEGTLSTRRHPLVTSAWFDKVAADILSHVAQAEACTGSTPSAEFLSTMVDVRILAHLAQYHALRIGAGLEWSLFQHARDLCALDKAIAHERQAITAWARIVTPRT
jgi:hypothetical protein